MRLQARIPTRFRQTDGRKTMSGNIKACIAEAIGTFALVFIGAGALCVDAITGGKLGPLGTGLAYALAVMSMTFTYQRASGAHFNPAVTVAMLINNRIEPIKAVFYLISQLLGAALGGMLLKMIFHATLADAAPFLGACDLSGVGYKAGTLLEAIATFFLVGTLYATQVAPRAANKLAPIAIGIAILMGALLAGPLTGGAMNPARAFGPAVATGRWAHWYVYWVGPLAGAITASLIYEKIFLERKR